MTTTGALMHQSTLIVLIFLTLGQILLLSCGIFMLWLAGELGDAPEPSGGKPAAPQGLQTTIAMADEAEGGSVELGEQLPTLAEDHEVHPIQPQASEDRTHRDEQNAA